MMRSRQPQAASMAAIQMAIAATRRLATQDPEWAQVETFFRKLWLHLLAEPRNPGSEQERWNSDHTRLVQQANDQLFVPRGWLFMPNLENLASFTAARINRSSSVPARYIDAAGRPQTRIFPVYWGEKVDLGAGFGAAKDTAANEFGLPDHPVLFIDTTATAQQIQEAKALANPASPLAQAIARGPVGESLPILLQGMLRDGWAKRTAKGVQFAPGIDGAMENLNVAHEAAHAFKKPASGIVFGDENEAFVRLTELVSNLRYTQLATHLFGYIVEAAQRPPEQPLTLETVALARALGDNTLAAQFQNHNTAGVLPLFQRLMALDDKAFETVVRQARAALGRNLAGPTDFDLEFPNAAQPFPIGERTDWREAAARTTESKPSYLTTKLTIGGIVAAVTAALVWWRRRKSGPAGGASVRTEVPRSPAPSGKAAKKAAKRARQRASSQNDTTRRGFIGVLFGAGATGRYNFENGGLGENRGRPRFLPATAA